MQRILSWVLWPALLLASLGASWALFQSDLDRELGLAAIYVALAALVGLIERFMPHERRWLKGEGDTATDLAFTVFGSALPELLGKAAVVMVLGGAARWLATCGGGPLWPTAWPLAIQVGLVLLVAEFGHYWAHRLGHTWPLLWRVHAVHHSVTRLYFLNTGRFHPLDTLKNVLLGLPLVVILAPPPEVLYWYLAIYNSIGLLSHCNIEMRLGFLDYIFNTPGVHRWHHSRVPSEGNSNYGENLMIFDLIFGTHFSSLARPPVNVGMDEPMPQDFAGQMWAPFRRKRAEAAPSPVRESSAC